METVEADRRYVQRWFWSLDQLARATGGPPEAVTQLIEAGCAPGPIYVLTSDNHWWSAVDDGSAPRGTAWYSPASAWGLRRSFLAIREGMSAAEAAEAERAYFVGEFIETIGSVDGAALAFPACFVGQLVDAAAAADQAHAEWDSWLAGGYGVCLRIFTAGTCLRKESLGAALKHALAAGQNPGQAMLRQAEELACIILPFAPSQRGSTTPGRTIDPILGLMKLGSELPYE
jgi:hypothetical protein